MSFLFTILVKELMELLCPRPTIKDFLISSSVCFFTVCDIYDLSGQVSVGESLAAMSIFSSKIKSSGTRILPQRLGWEFAKIQ